LSPTQEAVGSHFVLYPLKKLNAQELADLKAQLRQLPASSTPLFPYGERRQLVADLLDELLFLREQGYSYSQISDLLNEKTGVLIKPKTLRRYFFEEQAKQRGTYKQAFRSQLTPHRNRWIGRTSLDQTAPVPPLMAEEDEPSVLSQQPPPAQSAPPVLPAEPSPAPAQRKKPSKLSRQPDPEPGWDDDNPPAGGLLNEPKFNVIERD